MERYLSPATIPDSYSKDDTATHIAENYPWEASAWFWTTKELKSAGGVSLNDYIVQHGDSEGVYFVTQCFVNGWPAGLTNETAVAIRNGEVEWNVQNGRLYVNGAEICKAPAGWDNTTNIYNRENTYNEAIEAFN